ncbi:MAG TPA: AAA family ATPase [Acidobacteriaceae bacterium]|nr:AAA family ATPase [Acidobacteriaceae bacterium]
MSFFNHFGRPGVPSSGDNLQPRDVPAANSSEHSLSPEAPAAATRQADLVCLADIEPRPVDWLWEDRLAIGALSVLSGDPGSGKTWIALAIAAALSRGREPASFSGIETAGPCNCLYASTGNGAAELLRPRFAALDGDPDRLFLLRGALATGSTQSAALSLRDLPMLEDALERTHARLLIIDALHSFLGTGSHRANDSGRTFDNLAHLAENHRCCILLVRHLRRRGRGVVPVELSAAVRTEFLTGSSPDAPTRPALVHVKSNLGCLAPSLGYSIDQAGSFSWTGYSKLAPDELMTDRPIGAGMPLRKLAAGWLREYLSAGQRSQYNVETAAQRDGICIRTLRRAKFDLGVVSTKESMSGCWNWALPEDQEPANA